MYDTTLHSGGSMQSFDTALQHYQHIYHYLHKHLPEQAEDLTQEVFLKAWRAWHRFQPGTHITAWLLTIAEHLLIDTLRKRSVHPALSLDALTATLKDCAHPENPLLIEKTESDPQLLIPDYDLLRRTLARLPEQVQRLLLIHAIGYSKAEIMQMMQWSAPAYHSRMNHARAALREHYRLVEQGVAA